MFRPVRSGCPVRCAVVADRNLVSRNPKASGALRRREGRRYDDLVSAFHVMLYEIRVVALNLGLGMVRVIQKIKVVNRDYLPGASGWDQERVWRVNDVVTMTGEPLDRWPAEFVPREIQ
ncbi:MAG: hypothetical protein CFH37_01397 [Alphaproteobacteria bacterium MarineAlpha9_Bin7]|nr:MAG: hypothetical protein CFH37_01397 [Alphaproteobacteria bacterium MarineAlpha9_Bin7]